MAKVELKNGSLVITVPFDKNGAISSTGKTLLHATASDKQILGGKQVTIGVNAYSPNPDYVKSDKK